MGKIIGIDCGTTNLCLSVMENGSPVVIANSEGKRTTPSVVGFTSDGERKIGDSAKRQAVTNPKNTIYEIKRLIGNKHDECKTEINRVTYNVVNDNGRPMVDVDGKKYSPEQITAMYLQKLKKEAEDYLGEKVEKCVVTVPAYFNQDQRQATQDAATIAGMECVRIINEPTAAAIAYGVDKSDKDMNIVVFDFGGGTHDVSILSFGGGVFEVLSTNGDTHLGGSDVDERITNWIIDEFKKEEGFDLSKDPMALQRVKEASEKAKIELSSALSTDINLPYITAVDGVPKHINKTLTRAKFESLIEDIVKRTITPCENALKAAKLSTNDIDEILLVGGSTRIPCVQKAVEKFFGKAPSKSINPDECVAIGAAVQGAILNQEEGAGDIVLLDVTPLNLGIETMGGVLTTILEANTTIPCKKEMTFSNAVDMQPNASIMVYSGNRPMASQNKLLGQFNIELVPSARGMNQITVTFDMDANGLLTVSAVDNALNKPNKITIEGKSSLTKDEIDRMKAEAEKYADEDKKKAEEAQTINDGDSFAFSIEKALEEMKDKITDDEKNNIEPKIEALKKAVKEKNIQNVKTCRIELEQAWNPIVQKVYQSQNGAQNNGNANNDFMNMFNQATNEFGGHSQPNKNTNDDVSDADFQEAEEVK